MSKENLHGRETSIVDLQSWLPKLGKKLTHEENLHD